MTDLHLIPAVPGLNLLCCGRAASPVKVQQVPLQLPLQVGSAHLASHHLYDDTPEAPDVGRTPVTFSLRTSDDFRSHVCCGGHRCDDRMADQHSTMRQSRATSHTPHGENNSMWRGTLPQSHTRTQGNLNRDFKSIS